ncbi:MAG: transporter substrate-binding domain-containing protein [Clostridia bacterium]|nr:transporter substrate-binding domain-containing protein [Clostridia bacterium]
MKKIVALMLALMLTLGASLALADTFKMGIDAEYPPFSYLDDNGNYAGFDVEMCKGVCDLYGWDLEIVPVNWDTKLISLDNNEHDCVWSGMTILDTMKEAGYVLSFPYYDNTQVVLTKEASGIKTLADLAGKRVAVQLGTSGEALLSDAEGQLELAKTFDGGAPVTMENFNICGTELDAGGVDAVVIDLPVAQTLSAKFNGFTILEETLGSEQYGICFRKGEEDLCKKVEDGIMKLVENGTYLSLAEKYGLDANVLCLLNKAE